MPRISYSLLLRAHRIDPLLPPLLRECRDLCSARNELRWLTEYARGCDTGVRPGWRWRQRLQSLVRQRAAGKPLQYILGDQPFGDLEILCREEVLIPRPDTESYTRRIAQRLLAEHRRYPAQNIRIIDICTGTGCIPLLLHSLLAPSIPTLSIIGVDISPIALALAKKNLEHNIENGNLLSRARDEIHFVQADIMAPCSLNAGGSEFGTLLSRLQQGHYSNRWDLLISNPPYISPREFANGTTKRSVRLYEPKLALVPPPIRHTGVPSDSARADSFYPRLLAISAQLNARYTVLECGDSAQARRVATLVDGNDKRTEIWRCDWDIFSHGDSTNATSTSEGDPGTSDVMKESYDCSNGPEAMSGQGARAVVVSIC